MVTAVVYIKLAFAVFFSGLQPLPYQLVPVPMKTRRPWGWQDISWDHIGEAGEEKVKGG